MKWQQVHWRGPAAVLLLVMLWFMPCFAQSQSDPLRFGQVAVTGSVRTRLEGWQWFRGQGNTDYTFSGSLLRVSFGHESYSYDWQLELEAPVLLGLPRNAVGTGATGQFGLGAAYTVANRSNQNTAMLFPAQGFLRFKRLFGRQSDSIRLGRFQFADGGEVIPKDATIAAVKASRVHQRLLGNFTFTHVQRGFYGVHYQRDTPKLNWTVMASFPTRGVFQTDGWGVMKTALAYTSLTRQLPGPRKSAEWRLFGIYYDDWRGVLKSDNRAVAARQADLAPIRIGTMGGHLLHSARTSFGTTDLLFWTAFQFGKWGSLNQRAASVDVEAGLQPAILKLVRPWIRVGYTYGSGDGNPGDATHGTFFQILPTPRQFALFPFYNMMNNRDIFGILILRPRKALTVKHEIHWLGLASSSDLWYSGGGAFQPWTFGFSGRPANGGKGLANVYDINADYALNARTSVTAYWGYAVGHAAIAGIYPANKNGSLGFLELTLKF